MSAPDPGGRRRSQLSRALLGPTLVALALTACRSTEPPPPSAALGPAERGIASWYGAEFHGKRTANGERYDMHELTCAHRTLPFGTWIEVRDLDNGRTVRVRVNDRGPWVRGRIVDLSYAAARALDMIGPGTARVEIRPLTRPELLTAEQEGASYTVQVGAFNDRDRAERLRDELRASYPDTVVRTDGIWNRVQVGRYPDRPSAERIRRRLEELGFAALLVALP